MSYLWTKLVATPAMITTVAIALGPVDVRAAPSAEVAKRCIHYSYMVYPYKRPGAVRMSGDRQTYVKNCMEKDGDVPAPAPNKKNGDVPEPDSSKS